MQVKLSVFPKYSTTKNTTNVPQTHIAAAKEKFRKRKGKKLLLQQNNFPTPKPNEVSAVVFPTSFS